MTYIYLNTNDLDTQDSIKNYCINRINKLKYNYIINQILTKA